MVYVSTTMAGECLAVEEFRIQKSVDDYRHPVRRGSSCSITCCRPCAILAPSLIPAIYFATAIRKDQSWHHIWVAHLGARKNKPHSWFYVYKFDRKNEPATKKWSSHQQLMVSLSYKWGTLWNPTFRSRKCKNTYTRQKFKHLIAVAKARCHTFYW